jgi:hypothetical protein
VLLTVPATVRAQLALHSVTLEAPTTLHGTTEFVANNAAFVTPADGEEEM